MSYSLHKRELIKTDIEKDSGETYIVQNPVLDLDEDSGLGMEEINQEPIESPFLCSSFGELLSILDEDLHNTSLSELQGNLHKLQADDSSITKRSLFHQKRQLDTETPRKTSKRQRRAKQNRILKKSLSFEDRPQQSDNIESVVDKLFDKDLIADGSKLYCLSTITGKHRDLKSIDQQTVADLVSGKFDDTVGSYRIIDCRYPFEYDGGHIQGAENLYTQESILKMAEEKSESAPLYRTDGKRDILIFHCEFSSERGPKMCRLLRNKDRELNAVNYPHLNFPEVYLLEGGYKAFYENNTALCEPMSYKPMLHKDHAADVRLFRSKSKSWTAGEKRKNLTRILF